VFAEATIAGLNMLGVGMLIMALTRETRPRGIAAAVVLAAGLAVKAIVSFTLSKAAGPFAWITPGVTIGVLVSAVVLFALGRMPRRVQWKAAMASFAAAVVAINVGPENPYQTLPPQLLTAGPTHFLSFSGIIRALSELWPFLALVYTGTLATRRNASARTEARAEPGRL
jgi:hypothetical protein